MKATCSRSSSTRLCGCATSEPSSSRKAGASLTSRSPSNSTTVTPASSRTLCSIGASLPRAWDGIGSGRRVDTVDGKHDQGAVVLRGGAQRVPIDGTEDPCDQLVRQRSVRAAPHLLQALLAELDSAVATRLDDTAAVEAEHAAWRQA